MNEFIDVDLDHVDMRGALPDEVYAERLKMMATEVQLPYNDIVKKYILTYTRRGGTMERVLGLAQYYFPIFEEALYRYKLPMELKMLPVIESALVPRAQSRAAAVGLWQFMLRTGKAYGLEINTFVDERSDPVKSTEAACRYLKDMYRMYGDWTLVIAAYNCGFPDGARGAQRGDVLGLVRVPAARDEGLHPGVHRGDIRLYVLQGAQPEADGAVASGGDGYGADRPHAPSGAGGFDARHPDRGTQGTQSAVYQRCGAGQGAAVHAHAAAGVRLGFYPEQPVDL